MGEMVYVPLGEFKPDLRFLNNDGLVVAENVVPVYGNYLASPGISTVGPSGTLVSSSAVPNGLHVHQETGVGYAGFNAGGIGRIFSIDEAGAATDRSKAGNYTLGRYWYGTSFGQNVIMTNQRLDPVQYLPSGASAFADLITSTFAPKADLCFSLGPNLFLAGCNVPALYDGLSAGDHPMLVAWSRNDDPRQFGSFNADPQIIGSGYQDLLFDIGEIRAAVAGNSFAMIGLSNGFVRVDGPPYAFSVLCRNIGALWPYGMCAAGDDIFVWTQAGLARFRGGDGAPEIIGLGKWTRFITDNATGFSAHPIATQNLTSDLSMAHDPLNNLIFMVYREQESTYPSSVLCYNINEDRVSWFNVGMGSGNQHYALFLRPGRQSESSWCPGRDIRFIDVNSALNSCKYAKFALVNSGQDSVIQPGYIQFKRDQTTRIVRIRPIYGVSDQAAAEHVSVSISTTNKPYGTPTVYGPYSTVDSHGWITTPTTVFGDWHSPKFTFTTNADIHKVVEYEAFEAEVLIGPNYSA